MTDDTRDLLNIHHAAILRELDGITRGVNSLKGEMNTLRDSMDEHTQDDNTRFSDLTNKVGILGWAYGAGVVLLGAIWMLLKLGKIDVP